MNSNRTCPFRLRACTLLVVAGLVVLSAAACNGPSAADRVDGHGTGRINVVATTGMIADLVRHVGGERVEVTQLMGAGVDPHLYKVSTGDIRRLNQADIIFYTGLHLEGKMAEVFDMLRSKRPTLAVGEQLPRERLLVVGEAAYDPHVWFDVELWGLGLAPVAEALAKYDPKHAEEYRRRAAEYRSELLALDKEVRERLASIPEERRVLVTAHDAFQYFGRAYDIEVRSIQGISTESEAGVREINELVDFLVSRGIKAVFVESTLNERNVYALIEGAQARGHDVRLGGELYSDAMGPPGTPAGTYVGMVRHNVETIVRALQ